LTRTLRNLASDFETKQQIGNLKHPHVASLLELHQDSDIVHPSLISEVKKCEVPHKFGL